ncbi:unnamed protein product [Aphanomyces euteiches]
MHRIELTQDIQDYILSSFERGESCFLFAISQHDLSTNSSIHDILGQLPSQILRGAPQLPTIHEAGLLRDQLSTVLSLEEHPDPPIQQQQSAHDSMELNSNFEASVGATATALEHIEEKASELFYAWNSEDSSCDTESNVESETAMDSDIPDSQMEITPSSDFVRVFEWLQLHEGWTRQPGLWNEFTYFKAVAFHAPTGQNNVFVGDEAVETYWRTSGDWYRAMAYLESQRQSTEDRPDRQSRRKPRCSLPGCTHIAASNRLCLGHGGGKACIVTNCLGAAMGGSGKCKKHGGGSRCSFVGCDKSAQGGGKCKAHGGGKKCLWEGCVKAAQRRGFCASHGGKVNCSVNGCHRTDRGGGLCEVHRADILCQHPGCHRLAKVDALCSAHSRQQRAAHQAMLHNEVFPL